MTFVFRREQADNYADALDCLPAGKYRVMITTVETKETRSGTGRYMRLKMVHDRHDQHRERQQEG